MSIIKAIYSAVLDSLFPISKAEQAVISLGPEGAYHELPRAPKAPILLACSYFAYKDERVWRLIWAIKYKKSRACAAIAGYALWRILSAYSVAIPGPIILVPMPITKKRRRERGYNQCELIVDEIEKLEAKNWGANKRFVVARDLLVRTQHKARQTMKDRSERIESAKNLFEVVGTSSQYDKKSIIFVIDDVVTTGSTIKSAVMALREAGFENTWGMSVAH